MDATAPSSRPRLPAWTRGALLARVSQGLRINDVLLRGFPAGPPGLLRFALDIPKGARLQAAVAIDPRFHDRPGVEFVVKVRRGGREDVAFSLVVDPIARAGAPLLGPRRRGPRALRGKGRELVLETRGYEKAGDAGHAFWGTPAITVARKAPLAIVYLVDTLRADHTGVYGYDAQDHPRARRLREGRRRLRDRRRARLVDQALGRVDPHVAPARPAPRGAAARPARSAAGDARAAARRAGLRHGRRDRELGDLRRGVRLRSRLRLFAGLHGDDDTRSKLVGADVVVDQALAFLRSRRGMPRFLYVHTMDPHVPYAPPAPFDRMFEPHATDAHPARDPRTDYKEPLDRERMIAQYDGDIAFGDREFGRFVRELKAMGLYDDALVVFLADHGEEFQDHGLWLHGRSLFDELIHIPLVVKFPGNRGAGTRVARQVQGVDVAPTVLEAMQVALSPDLAGRPLQRALERGEPPRPALAEISHRGFVAHGVRTEDEKYIRRFSPDDDELLFDLRRDPREKASVAAQSPERVRLRKAQVEAGMAQNPFRYVLQARGSGRLALRLETHGWLEAIELTGLGPQERSVVGGNGRTVDLLLQPREGAPREIAFTVRPIGAPVLLSGTRDGRPLRPLDVAIGEGGQHPEALPYRLPDIESETEQDRGLRLFAPRRVGAPRSASGYAAAGPVARRARRGDARAAAGARLRGPGLAWRASSSSTSTARSWTPRATSRPPSTRRCSGCVPAPPRSRSSASSASSARAPVC